MDPNTVVLEISSNEYVGWNDDNGTGISDGGDDHKWLKELLDEVSKENYGYDSDEVVVVSESENPGKKSSKLKSSLVDSDDDCVVLDSDPNEPVKVWNDKQSKGDEDSEDILLVREKGQVACRDYPHPRHLCIKFPFSTTPNQSHCEQCYCYVCDSLAPCFYWSNGSTNTDHCHATDKHEFWTLARKNAKNATKTVQPVHRPAPALVRPGSIHSRHTSANFRPPNIINRNPPIIGSRNKFRPDLGRAHQNYNLGTQLHRPVFKRTGSVRVATTARGDFVNYSVDGMLSGSSKYLGSLQSNAVNISQPRFSNHSNPNLQSRVNSNPFPVDPLYQQPHLGPLSGVVPAHPIYHVPSQTRVDTPHVIDPGFKDNGFNGSPSLETNESSLAVTPGGLADYRYDWIFDNQPVEPGFVDIHGPDGLNGFIDTDPIFEF